VELSTLFILIIPAHRLFLALLGEDLLIYFK